MTRWIGVTTAALLVAACGGDGGEERTATPVPAGVSAVRVVREGGIAGLTTTALVRRESPNWVVVQRRPCARDDCPPMDSASGVLPRDSVQAFFARLPADSFLALGADYGQTPGAADMYVYTVMLRLGDSTHTVRADEQTMPPTMRRVVDLTLERVDRSVGRGQ